MDRCPQQGGAWSVAKKNEVAPAIEDMNKAFELEAFPFNKTWR